MEGLAHFLAHGAAHASIKEDSVWRRDALRDGAGVSRITVRDESGCLDAVDARQIRSLQSI